MMLQNACNIIIAILHYHNYIKLIKKENITHDIQQKMDLAEGTMGLPADRSPYSFEVMQTDGLFKQPFTNFSSA